MNIPEMIYSIGILMALLAAAAGLSRLKRFLKRYALKRCADNAAG